MAAEKIGFSPAQSLASGVEMLSETGVIRRKMPHEFHAERSCHAAVDQELTVFAQKLYVQACARVIDLQDLA